jgi:hypothetical protein
MLTQVLPQLAHKALIIQDVKDAVAAGKIVTISQSTISYKGWTGAGYILIDPNTGAGAYLIGGGADGAIALFAGLAVGAEIMSLLANMPLLILSAAVGGALMVAAIAAIIVSLVAASIAFIKAGKTQDDKKLRLACFLTGISISMTIGSLASEFGAESVAINAKVGRIILGMISLGTVSGLTFSTGTLTSCTAGFDLNDLVT